ncbi:GTP-binding protein [Bacillus sp. V33-4]|nr:GTP-binding protein [Bacillus sp. V33-4]
MVEKQLIKKEFYQTFTDENDASQPSRVLGELYVKEQQKDVPDLSYIRFAQGEVYYANYDFEAAIFKWENIDNELEPWAKKNMADAYFALEILSTAESIYKSVQTDNTILKTEVSLQLFTLYVQQGKLDSATKVIKEAVVLNPDYPNITEIARTFFEEHGDARNAIELAVNEAIRTQSLHWFDLLNTYIQDGLTKKIQPDYFMDVLMALYHSDKKRLEKIVVSLWNSYKGEDTYFSWIRDMDRFLAEIEVDQSVSWTELSTLYQQSFLDLMSGKYLLKKLSGIVPNHLSNWLKISDNSHGLYSASAVLAWSELFPSTIKVSAAEEAENVIAAFRTRGNGHEESLRLFDTITAWSEQNEVEIGNRIKWLAGELADLNTHHLLIAGSPGNGKSAFINAILGENILENDVQAAVLFKGDEDNEITEIDDSEIRHIPELAAASAEGTVVDFKISSRFLTENGLSLFNIPNFRGTRSERNEAVQYLHLADSLLFVLDAGSPFTERERDLLLKIAGEAPNLPVHFLLNNIDSIADEQEAIKLVDDTWTRIHGYFPEAKLFAFSSNYESTQQLSDLAEFIQANASNVNTVERRNSNLLFLIRETITMLLKSRVEMENGLIESIKWNEEMANKLNGAINQLSDVEKEKINIIQKSYRGRKQKIKNELEDQIPKLLQGCSDIIEEDSDFGSLHVKLNDEMNRRIREYLSETMLPKFNQELEEWIEFSKNEFGESQAFLADMSDGFNSMFEEERIKLECDFKVLDDWRRDADRMTSGVPVDTVNILLRFTPSQFLLKSAGKLFGAIQQNKVMLYNKYTQFVENEDYEEAKTLIINNFMQPFEMFERTLQRDVTIFFRNPFRVLKQTVEETQSEIVEKQAALDQIRTNPELYRDPLRMFEVRLRQLEWMEMAGKQLSHR